MKILGYSERGIINSLISNIGENKEFMDKFIKLVSFSTAIDFEEPIDYTILLEQSLSRFGDSDLIIIVKYNKAEDNRVIFFEGKVKTCQGNWNIDYHYNKYKSGEEYVGSSSNLFFQLHLKKLLIDNYSVIKKTGEIIEPIFGVLRKIGKNPVVNNAFDLIECRKAYFIGIVPTKTTDIKNFIKLNKTDLNFLSWESIYDFCVENKLSKVLEMFKYNEGQIY